MVYLTVNISDYRALNDNELRIGKGCGRKKTLSNVRHYPNTFLDHENCSQDSKFLGQYLNLGTPMCDTGVLTIQL
jgi:hypothetical protein